MRVVVVGAGASGLSVCAHLVRRRDVGRVTLVAGSQGQGSLRFSAGEDLSTGLWSPALRVLRGLGVLEEVKRKGRYLGLSGYKAFNCRDARDWLMKPVKGLGEDLSLPALLFIKSSDLLSILRKTLSPTSASSSLDIIYDDCTSIDESSVLTSRGQCLAFDLLVAADGSDSHIRRMTDPHFSPPVYRGYSVFRGTITKENADRNLSLVSATLLQQQAWQSFGPGCRFAVVPTIDGYQWYAAVTMPQPQSLVLLPETPLNNGSRSPNTSEYQALLAALSHFHAPTLELVQLTLPTLLTISSARSSTFSAPPSSRHQTPSKLKHSRIVPVGDANFTLDPILAVGTGVAIEDGWLLAEALDLVACSADDSNRPRRVSAVAVLKRLDEMRRDRLQRLSVISDLAGGVGHLESAWACYLRDGLLKALPNAIKGRCLDSFISTAIESKVPL